MKPNGGESSEGLDFKMLSYANSSTHPNDVFWEYVFQFEDNNWEKYVGNKKEVNMEEQAAFNRLRAARSSIARRLKKVPLVNLTWRLGYL